MWARKERLGGDIAGYLLELGHVVHDSVELLHQPIELGFLDGQLGQPSHVTHFLATNAHALSISRSSPA